MNIVVFRNIAVVLVSLLVPTCYSVGQNITLKGTIRDAVTNSPIAGVDVVVRTSLGATPKQISDANGHYSILGLSKDDKASITCSLGGYVPHPRTDNLSLNGSEVIKDVVLIQDTAASSYWGVWTNKTKDVIEALRLDKQHATQAYEQMWYSLGRFGVSAEAQVEAARQLQRNVPVASDSSMISTFASVKPKDLKVTEDNIRAASEGQVKLERNTSIPPEVATAVAADSLKKQRFESQKAFYEDFSATWGEKAGQDLQGKLSNESLSTTDIQRLSSLGAVKGSQK